MNEYISFDKFVTPIIIQIVFWIGLAGIVLVSLTAIVQGQGAQGLVLLLIGPVIWRVYTEILLVLFKIYEELREMNQKSPAKTFS